MDFQLMDNLNMTAKGEQFHVAPVVLLWLQIRW